MNVFLTVFLAALSSCLVGTGPAPQAQKLSAPSEYFPAPQKGISLQVSAEKMPRLSDLLGEFSRATGMTIVSDESTRRMLEAGCGLNQDVEVPPAQVYGFTESVLSYHGFLLYHLRSESPRLLGVTHPRALNDSSGSIKPVHVPLETLGSWKDHPAFLVQTLLTLDHVDVRVLSNSMRPVFNESRMQQLVPVGNSNSILITAPASMTTNIVEMFERADEESAKAEKAEKAAKALEQASKPAEQKAPPK
jgi:hypothetical protein